MVIVMKIINILDTKKISDIGGFNEFHVRTNLKRVKALKER